MSQVKKEVDVEFNVITPFGPKVGVGALPKAIYKKFEKIANKTLKEEELPLNSELAGRINSEYRINDKHFTNTNLGAFVDKSVEVYLRTCIMEVQGEAAAKNTQINLERWDGWVNEMKSYEYNPAHFHPHCQISTIFFFSNHEDFMGTPIHTLHGPDKTDGHLKDYTTDGCLEFICKSEGSAGQIELGSWRTAPQKGDFYIFPAYLLHTVYPFVSDKTRISASINYNVGLSGAKHRQQRSGDNNE